MSSWYSSWLPGLPTLNFAIPSNLQGRFVSFLLKKCLGHFLKPGQLDVRQIESQMGSGFVQVNDLELNNEAINSFFNGLPLALSDGYISTVTAHVPWPNPLSSNLGLSLDALHLTFRVTPVPNAPQGADLAESVASVADSFVHEELTEQENTALWASAHPEIVDEPDEPDNHIPGALDPFILNHHEEVPKSEHEVVGVSLFSTLIERLLARFEFTAVNTKITIIHEGNMCLTIAIPEIRYTAEGKSGTGGPSSSAIKGILAMSGITVTTQNLRSPAKAATSHGCQTTNLPSISSSPDHSLCAHCIGLHSASPATSSSSLDEETEALMSQSLVALPPRRGSPADSAASSLYQSALESSDQGNLNSSRKPQVSYDSTMHMSGAKGPGGIHDETSKEDVSENIMFSFGTAPLTIRIGALSPPESDTDETSFHSNLKVSVTAGVIASAIHAWQLAGMAEIMDFFIEHKKAKPAARSAAEPKLTSVSSSAHMPEWMLDVNLKEVVVLVLPANLGLGMIPSLNTFFVVPSNPPRLFSGYLRLSAKDVVTKASSASAPPSAPDGGRRSDLSPKRDMIFELICGDINASVYSFQSPSTDMVIYPVLTFDHHLKDQYTIKCRPGSDIMDTSLPTFTVNEWGSAKLRGSSSEQVMPHAENVDHGFLNQSDEQPIQSGEDEKPPAVHVHVECFSNYDRGTYTQAPQNDVSVSILPVCIQVDIQQLIGNANVSTFLHEISRKGGSETKVFTAGVEDNDIAASESDHSDITSAKSQTYTERDEERRRLERLVMEDLGLSVNFPNYEPEPIVIRTPRTKGRVKRRTKSQTQTNISLVLSMVRVCLRCSPLPGQLPRFGVLFIDFHHLSLSTAERHDHRLARFEPPVLHTDQDLSRNDPLLHLECDAIMFAISPVGEAVATTIVSLSSLHDYLDPVATNDANTRRAPLKPRVSVSSAVDSGDTGPQIALDVDVPFVHLNLTKEALDGLLYLADDATRLLELEGPPSNHQEKTHNGVESASRQLHISASITEVTTCLMAQPSDADQLEIWPFHISASDVVITFDVGAEMSVGSVEAMELSIKHTSRSGEIQTILARTVARHMSPHLKSALKLSFTSSLVPDSKAKVSKITSTLWGLTGTVFPDTLWVEDLKTFFQSPPGASIIQVFESVIPSERTTISLKVEESAARVFSPTYPGGLVLHLGDLEFMTEIVGNATENTFRLLVSSFSLLGSDEMISHGETGTYRNTSGVSYWKSCGYALIAEITESMLNFSNSLSDIPDTKVECEKINLRIHLCADTLTAISKIGIDWQRHLGAPVTEDGAMPRTEPAMVSDHRRTGLTSSVHESAFRRLPEIGPAPDMISDDLPTNLDYLDESFSAAAGLRELSDEDLDDFRGENDFDIDLDPSTAEDQTIGITSRVGGETIKMMRSEGVQVIEGYFESLPGDALTASSSVGDISLRILVHDCNFTLCLYDGYDWEHTRKTIEEEMKDMRRRLARLKQLVASGQTPDASMEEMSTVLFNSVYIGLDQGAESLEPGALLAAIDEHLNDDTETASQSSWQSLRPHSSGKAKPKSTRVHGKRLTRSKGPSMEFVLTGAKAEIEYYRPSDALLSRTFITVKDVEIFDHIKTSTWRKFLTALQLDSRGNTRETDSDMVRVELQNVRPVPGHPSEEVRLRAKILPLRLYVDQDAVDFLKKFFSFKDPNAGIDAGTSSSQSREAFIQFAEVFPVLLKLDYKPRRVDYKALRDGRTIELMNFFHFDGAEMTLRHITLTGITGWARFFELLNDLWTPDVKATQLVDVISGVAPIRSVVNVGSGVADLVLLPIAQYKKDGRVLRGLQKGTTAFFRSTALEAIKLGARLATGTQVILEQAEGVLGGQFQQPVTTETIPEDAILLTGDVSDDERVSDIISKYADQPIDIKEGVQSAYKSLRKNFNSAAQTILAVPMEIYERSGDEGAIRSVIRAVPIAVLKPMIGATEAVSKTLLGLHNTLDSNVRHDNEAKYKHR